MNCIDIFVVFRIATLLPSNNHQHSPQPYSRVKRVIRRVWSVAVEGGGVGGGGIKYMDRGQSSPRQPSPARPGS